MDVTDKIRKLLALADRAGTPEEAAVAAANAARLMTKHGLDHEDVTRERDPYGLDDPLLLAEFRGPVPLWRKVLASDLARLCGCYCYQSRSVYELRSETETRLRAVGRPGPRRILAALYPAIVHTIGRLSAKARADVSRRARWSEAAFCLGATHTIVGRMYSAQNEVLRRVRSGAVGAMVHVPRREADEVKRAAKEAIGLLAAKSQKRPGGPAFDAGRRAASTVKIPGEHDAVAGMLAIKSPRTT